MCHLNSFMVCHYLYISNTEVNSDTKTKQTEEKTLFKTYQTNFNHISYALKEVQRFVWEKNS